MPQYLQNNQIDYQKWDACIAASRQHIVYAYSWYLDSVSPGWEGLVVEKGAQYQAVMPLPVLQKFKFSYLQQPFFCQQLGVFSLDSYPLDLASFLDEVQKHFAYTSHYAFNTANTSELGTIKKLSFGIVYTHHLNLHEGYSQLYQNYSSDRKVNLKRAKKANLEIREEDNIEGLIDLFRSGTERKITGGVAAATYQMLRHLFTQLQGRGLVRLFYTYTASGELDAGCLFVIHQYKIIYLFNAASVKGRSRNGRTLILDKIIQEYAGTPYVFDFESPTAELPIIRVYQGFGAQATAYPILQFNHLPAPIKLIKKIRQLFYQRVLPAFSRVL